MATGHWWRGLARNARAARHVVRAAMDTHRPLLAQIVPMRRCNLACGYCNEYDHASQPVPLERVERWLDKLEELGTGFVTVSGGEPMLHPHLVEIIAGIRRRGMMPGLITNGFYLTPAKIQALNAAGLDYLQMSIDNVEPDVVSKKSLRLVDRHLEELARYARFDVNINSVIGGGTGREADVRQISARARALGFSVSVGVVHDATGRLKPFSPAERAVWEEFHGLNRRKGRLRGNFYSTLNGFQRNLVDGLPNVWKCRGGARYLYIAEDGRVSRCSQQRGLPGIPIERYTPDDVQREFVTLKPCTSYCTIACVHRTSTMDHWLDLFRNPTPDSDRTPGLDSGERARS